ncbi:MAG: hypothetical protein U1C51_05495, partial [Candidatus Izemoplasmatales bacterium]|nr:hypothetical protein [Candidatus Izemoplasmatales bacterium]
MKPAQALSLVMFREYYSIRRFLGTNYNKSKLKSIGMIFVIPYALGTVLFGFGYLFFELGKILEVAQLLPILLGFIFFYVSALSIMYVMFRADGYLFHFKDYELIAPLPISPLNIVIIKMKLMLLMLYIMSFFMILPIAFSYFYFQGFDMLSFLFLLGSFIVIPLIPTVLFSLVSIIFQRITQQFRQSKIVSIVLWLILTVFLLVGSFAFSFDGDNPLMGQQTMITWFLNNYSLANWFTEAIVDHNVIS